MDGTIYLGGRLFDCAFPFLDAIKNMGAEYMFMTNNSSKSSEEYLKKLDKMGVPCKPNRLLSSTIAAKLYLQENFPNARVFASGTRAFLKEIFSEDIWARPSYKRANKIKTAEVCLMGFDTEINFKKLENLCKVINKGVPYIATNPDWVCPTEYGFVPDCGSIAFGLEKATGRAPLYMGKPQKYMADLALKTLGVSKAESIIIGDRIYTDILCGVNSGIDTVLVLSGEAKLEDVKDILPTYIANDLSKLLIK